MGDRVWARITIAGHIETIEECKLLVEAIVRYGPRDTETDNHIISEDLAMQSLRRTIEDKAAPMFEDSEVNYGEFDDLEDVVAEVPGLGCSTQFEGGGGFDAGIKTIMPDGSIHRSSHDRDGGATISLGELQKAREADDPLAAIDELLKQANLADGGELPEFTVSPTVAAWLKIFANKAA